MRCKAGQYKTSTPYNIFIMTPSLEGSPTKAKETKDTKDRYKRFSQFKKQTVIFKPK